MNQHRFDFDRDQFKDRMTRLFELAHSERRYNEPDIIIKEMEEVAYRENKKLAFDHSQRNMEYDDKILQL